jgi:hypothetical protein
MLSAEARSAQVQETQSEMLMLQRCISAEDDEEAESLMDAALGGGVGGGGGMGRGAVLAELQSAEDVDTSELETLLQQLKSEPGDDVELAEKFGLYEVRG